jgi:hypothetical protein
LPYSLCCSFDAIKYFMYLMLLIDHSKLHVVLTFKFKLYYTCTCILYILYVCMSCQHNSPHQFSIIQNVCSLSCCYIIVEATISNLIKIHSKFQLSIFSCLSILHTKVVAAFFQKKTEKFCIKNFQKRLTSKPTRPHRGKSTPDLSRCIPRPMATTLAGVSYRPLVFEIKRYKHLKKIDTQR